MENIRVIEKCGKYVGKNVVILAGVHGDEVCGVKAFDELIPKINIEKGRVTFIYANLEAGKQNKRFVECNLNRCFLDDQPYELKYSLEGKTAKAIIPYLKKADIVLDLHSSKSSGNNPFLICEEDCLEIINCLSPKKVIMGIDNAQKGGSDGYMFNLGKQGICVECGLHDSQESVEVAKQSILNLLKKAESVGGDCEKYKDKKSYRVKYMYKSKNGMFKLAGKFQDFHQVNEKTLIGLDGDEKVYIEKGDVVMFPNEPKQIGKECFVIMKEE